MCAVVDFSNSYQFHYDGNILTSIKCTINNFCNGILSQVYVNDVHLIFNGVRSIEYSSINLTYKKYNVIQ